MRRCGRTDFSDRHGGRFGVVEAPSLLYAYPKRGVPGEACHDIHLSAIVLEMPEGPLLKHVPHNTHTRSVLASDERMRIWKTECVGDAQQEARHG